MYFGNGSFFRNHLTFESQFPPQRVPPIFPAPRRSPHPHDAMTPGGRWLGRSLLAFARGMSSPAPGYCFPKPWVAYIFGIFRDRLFLEHNFDLATKQSTTFRITPREVFSTTPKSIPFHGK